MSERINMPFTNEHFVAFCEKMIGMPYWYGTVVYKCTENLRARKAKQYPAHYGSSRTARYRDDISKKKVCADCVGLIKGYQWTNGGQGVIESIGTDKTFSSRYGGHGCPDKSANGMFNYARSKGCAWGTMDTLPEVPGVALRFDGHVGVYVGNGYAVEERGFNYGCVRTRVKDRKWTHWYQLPFVDYGDAVFTGGIGVKADTPKTEYTLGTRTLKKGAKGTDVKAMQEFLLQLGYALPEYGADGDFGNETETALKKLQARAGVKQDGVYGSETHKALMDATADNDAGKESEQPDEPDQPNKPEQPEEPTQHSHDEACAHRLRQRLGEHPRGQWHTVRPHYCCAKRRFSRMGGHRRERLARRRGQCPRGLGVRKVFGDGIMRMTAHKGAVRLQTN